MKKRMMSITFASAMALAMCNTAFAEEQSLIHIEASEGIVDILGYEVVTEGDQNILCVIAEYENTTEGSAMPLMQYNISAFQDGIELEAAFTMYEPEGCKNGTLEIRPGATLRYADFFALTSDNEVELEVAPLFDLNDVAQMCVLDLSQSITPSSDSEEGIDYKAMYEELKAQYDELEAKYNALLEQQN